MAPAHGDAALVLWAAGSGGRVAVDVLDELGASLGPVGFPQLLAMMCVPRPEERRFRVCGGHEVFGPRRVWAGDDVLDDTRATRRTLGLPQLLAVFDGLGQEVDPLFGERLFVGLRRTGLRQLYGV